MYAIWGLLSLAGAAVCLVLLLVSVFRKGRKAPALIGLAACLVVFFLCLGFTPPRPRLPQPPAESTPTLSASPTATATTPPPTPPMASPSPSATPTPSQEPDYDAQLADYQEAVEQAATAAMAGLFDENAEGSVSFTPSTGALLIEAQGSDNLSVSLIRAAMLADIRDVMASLSGFTDAPPVAPANAAPTLAPEKVMFSIRFPLENGEVPIVLKATFTGEELRTAVWSSMDSAACEKAAAEFWTAPALN